MREQLEQILKAAGYRMVRPEALAPGLIAIIHTGLEYEPLAFGKTRKIHSFWIWTRVRVPDELETKAEEIMNVLWQGFNEISELRADFEGEMIQISIQIPEE